MSLFSLLGGWGWGCCSLESFSLSLHGGYLEERAVDVSMNQSFLTEGCPSLWLGPCSEH